MNWKRAWLIAVLPLAGFAQEDAGVGTPPSAEAPAAPQLPANLDAKVKEAAERWNMRRAAFADALKRAEDDAAASSKNKASPAANEQLLQRWRELARTNGVLLAEVVKRAKALRLSVSGFDARLKARQAAAKKTVRWMGVAAKGGALETYRAHRTDVDAAFPENGGVELLAGAP